MRERERVKSLLNRKGVMWRRRRRPTSSINHHHHQVPHCIRMVQAQKGSLSFFFALRAYIVSLFSLLYAGEVWECDDGIYCSLLAQSIVIFLPPFSHSEVPFVWGNKTLVLAPSIQTLLIFILWIKNLFYFFFFWVLFPIITLVL